MSLGGDNQVDEEHEESIAFRQPGICGKLSRWKQRISVEPVLFLYMFGTFMQNIVIVNLALDKACHVNFNRDSCVGETNKTSFHLFNASTDAGDDNDVQAYVATWNICRSVLENVPCIIFTLFLGPWSDTNGRKVPMMLPLAGQIISSGLFIAFYLLPQTSAEYLLIASVPIGLSGGWVSLLMSVYSYLSDITKEKSRTTRLAFLDLFAYAAIPLGSMASRYIYTYGGYIWIFGSCSGCMLMALLYIALFLPNTKDLSVPLRFDVSAPAFNPTVEEEDDDLIRKKEKPSSDGCCQVLNCKNVQNALAATFKTRPDHKRAIVLLSLLAMAVYVTGSSGFSNVSYLYARKIFGWDEPDFVTFQAVQVSISAIGTMVLLPFLSFKLKVSDPVLGIMAMVSLITMNLLYAFAYEEWMFYIGALMSLPSGAGSSVIRSTVSKAVPNEDLGKVFSILGSLESLTPLLGSALYNMTYQATLGFFPGFVCLLTVGLELIQAFIYLILLYIMRKVVNPHHILAQSE